ncbi:hypothetical protein, partial [Flavobacterium filum]
MKKIVFTLFLFVLFSSFSVKAQNNNQITFMLLLNEAKQNFSTIKGDAFNKSEDGKKTYHS